MVKNLSCISLWKNTLPSLTLQGVFKMDIQAFSVGKVD